MRWLTFICGLTALLAAEACAAPESRTRMDVQVVAMPVERAMKLKAAFQRNDSDAWKAVQAMLASGEARLLAWPVVFAGDAERVSNRGVEELMYPVDWALENGFGPGPRLLPLKAGAVMPIGFMVDNLGVDVQLGNVMRNPDGVIDIFVKLIRRELLRFDSYTGAKSGAGIEGVLMQPSFHIQRAELARRVRPGVRFLLHAALVEKPERHVECYLARLVVVQATGESFKDADK